MDKREQTYLFNKASQELDDTSQRALLEVLLRAQKTEHVDKVVIHCVVLRRQLSEEHASQVRNLLVFVLQAFGHLTQLPLDFDLARQDEEGECHETGAFHRVMVVVESAVEEVSILVDEMVEADSHVAERNDSIAANSRVFRSLHDCDQEREMLLTVLG